MAEKKITTIPATLNKFTSTPINSTKRSSRQVTKHRSITTPITSRVGATGNLLACTQKCKSDF